MSATLKADDFANYFNKVKLGAKNGNYRDYRDYMGGYIGIMEKKMETTCFRVWGFRL